MNIVALVQQRLGSTRLPKKAMAKIGDKTVTQWTYDRVAKSVHINYVTAISPKEDDQQELIDSMSGSGRNILNFDIPSWNVLQRHILAADMLEADVIVRVPADNVFVDPLEINRIIELFLLDYEEGNPDVFGKLYTNLDKNVLGNGYPSGLGAEVYSSQFLHYLGDCASTLEHCEHPHKQAYDNGWLKTVRADKSITAPGLKLSVDTQADLEFVRDIYDHMPVDFYGADIISYLRMSMDELSPIWQTEKGPLTWHNDSIGAYLDNRSIN